MNQVATLQIRDAASQENATIIIRQGDGRVALCISLESNGDVEVLLSTVHTQAVIDALVRAVSQR